MELHSLIDNMRAAFDHRTDTTDKIKIMAVFIVLWVYNHQPNVVNVSTWSAQLRTEEELYFLLGKII